MERGEAESVIVYSTSPRPITYASWSWLDLLFFRQPVPISSPSSTITSPGPDLHQQHSQRAVVVFGAIRVIGSSHHRIGNYQNTRRNIFSNLSKFKFTSYHPLSIAPLATPAETVSALVLLPALMVSFG